MAQQPRPGRPVDMSAKAISGDLKNLSNTLHELTERVGAAVVQINCTGLSLTNNEENGSAAMVTRQSSTGSGVLLSPDGYIMTNAHVVANARHIRVRLNGLKGTPMSSRQLEAKLIGQETLTDLALIKIDAKDLPYATLAEPRELEQGNLVLAFGSPLGLENSVSMGVVASVARQISPDDPRRFIQTDAAINPGNSGGPLVNMDGHVVGLNTFILTQSGGSEGIGFATPAVVVNAVYRQLKTEGHVHRGQIGVYVRAITPELQEGLHLPQDQGVLIEDVSPGSPAEQAGLKVGDIVVAMQGHPVEDVHRFAVNLYTFQIGQKMDMEVLRGKERVKLQVTVAEAPADPLRFADLVTQDNVVDRLGILALSLNKDLAAMISDLRIPSGVIVAARTQSAQYSGDGPKPGDVIHAVATQPITNLDELRTALSKVGKEDVIVLQVERSGTLQYLVLQQD
jgi:serine protease Do